MSTERIINLIGDLEMLLGKGEASFVVCELEDESKNTGISLYSLLQDEIDKMVQSINK